MSEELSSKYTKNNKIHGQVIGDFEYFQIGSTTFNQLRQASIIPSVFNKAYGSFKPDRLIVRRTDLSNPRVIAVIEDKKGGSFNSESEKIDAIRQCNNYCQELKAILGIITDGSITIWINPNEKNENTEYVDKNINKKRSYTLIKKEDGSEITLNFNIKEKEDLTDIEKVSDETKTAYRLIQEICQKINDGNSIIKQPGRIDPLPLARRVWQDIWVATGKSPEKCLYNVVELFIFKFLSDLEILVYPNDFDSLYVLLEKGKNCEEILQYYVKNCREEIYKKFPSGPDGTTIINGTIFVDEERNANVTQSTLFRDTLKKFKDFEKEFGKFSTHNIDKDFKTKLYESFLKQTAGLKALGQFFTPRKIVRAIVQMSGIKNFNGGERVCDPFCGVGGFILEPLNTPERSSDFKPINGKINSPIVYKGYDKGFEKDEERTIILAKANMLIYLSDLIAESKLTKEFAEAFNKTFILWRSNLGTLKEITYKEEDKFDLILTNPPYVKRGIRTLKNEIEENAELNNFYSVNGGGLEGLALEWIVRHIKKGGKAFIIVPDGLLNRIEDKKLRNFILRECFLDSIISLPQKTFYATPKKTYILAITKKKEVDQIQDFPVYTYLVSDIGETLDINRFETPEKNNLPEMVDLFREYQLYKNDKKVKELEDKSSRCKIQPLEKFNSGKSWCVDRWWTQEEKVELGIEEEIELLSAEEFLEKMQDVQETFKGTVAELNDIVKKKLKNASTRTKFKSVLLKSIIDFSQNTNSSNFTKSFVNAHKGDIPVYSASENPNFVGYGYVKDNLPGVKYFNDCMTWNIDGSVGKVFIKNGRFSLSEKVIPLILFPNFNLKLDKEYIKFAIEKSVIEEGYAFNNKASKSRLQDVEILIPVNNKGDFDMTIQKQIVKNNSELSDLQQKILDLKEKIESPAIGFDEEFNFKEVPIKNLFYIKQGNANFTKKQFLGNNWQGEIPVYSSNTKEQGLLMKINISRINEKYLYYQSCLTWSIDGYAGKIFIRNIDNAKNEKDKKYLFTINNHCGILLPKNNNLYLPFIKLILQPIFYNKAKGYGNNKLGTNQIEDVTLTIPINENGEYDIDAQKACTKKYEKIEEIKKELIDKLDLLISYSISSN